MTSYVSRTFSGERALFKSEDLAVEDCIFLDGESPLKESNNISVQGSTFDWKYPIWYCSDVSVDKSIFTTNSRAGIWYTDNLTIKNTGYYGEKGIRRCRNIKLSDVEFPNALETMWACENSELNNISVCGEYFAMNCRDISVDNLKLDGGYCFDGCRNVEINNSIINTKDAFWNCDNVMVKNSIIESEYVAWNSRNVTFVNCTIKSLQGFCYIKNLKMVNCNIPETSLAFEYSTVDVQLNGYVESIKNPISGNISCDSIGTMIFDDPAINRDNTVINVSK